MRLRPITTENEYDYWLEWTDRLLDCPPRPNTKESDKLQVVLLLIKDYEDKHYPVPSADPIETIKQTMKDKGLKNKDLITMLGVGKSYISAILGKKKPLTLNLAKRLHHELGIPAEVLLS